EGDDEAGDLDRGGSPFQDGRHRRGGLGGGEVLPPDELAQHRGPQRAVHAASLQSGVAQAVLRRWRSTLRRSRSVSPPHTPCFSRVERANSRQGWRTGQVPQMTLASSACESSSGGG